MIRIGLVGVGFMGWIHWLAYRKTPGVQVAAICTRSEKKLAGDWRGIQGNFGPPGEQVDLTGIARYSSLEQMLEDGSLDLIDICLPPDAHGSSAIATLAAGKHVFVEKPMALTAEECDRMVAAARKSGQQVLVGQVLPFFPEYAHARAVIASGQYGRLLGGTFKRVISDPLWLKDFFDPRRVGGPLVDLHVHDAHLIRLLLGMPVEVASRGRMRGEVVEYCQTSFHFADASLVVSAESGVIRQQGRGFTHGFEMHLEQATLQYEFAAFADRAELMPLKILAPDGTVVRPDLGDGDPVRAFEAEIAEVIQSLERGETSAILSGELARDAVVLCQRQTESVLAGKPIGVA